MALSQESTSQRELHKYSARSRRIGYIFASVWIIFLAFPLYFALAYPRQNILQEIALVLDILLIAPVFLYGSIKLNCVVSGHRSAVFGCGFFGGVSRHRSACDDGVWIIHRVI